MSRQIKLPGKEQRKESAIKVIREAANKWPNPFVSRREISNFTGGLLAPRTMANLDCAGEGPNGAFRIGRNIAYPLDSLVEWLIEQHLYGVKAPLDMASGPVYSAASGAGLKRIMGLPDIVRHPAAHSIFVRGLCWIAARHTS